MATALHCFMIKELCTTSISFGQNLQQAYTLAYGLILLRKLSTCVTNAVIYTPNWPSWRHDFWLFLALCRGLERFFLPLKHELKQLFVRVGRFFWTCWRENFWQHCFQPHPAERGYSACCSVVCCCVEDIKIKLDNSFIKVMVSKSFS